MTIPKKAAAVLVTVGVTCSLFTGVPAAVAAPSESAFTAVSLDKTQAHYTEAVKATFDIAVADDAKAGDKLSVTLPEELQGRGTRDITLTTPEGDEFASASWNEKTINVVLSKYVESHDDVTGEMFVTTAWDLNDPYMESKSFNLSFTTNTGALEAPLVFLPLLQGDSEYGDDRPIGKQGAWNDPIDEGNKNPDKAIEWILGLPASLEGYPNGIIVKDTAREGWEFDCDTTDFNQPITPLVRDFKNNYATELLPSDRYTATCEAGQITLEVPYVAPLELIDFSILADVTDTSLDVYKNTADFDIIGVGVSGISAELFRSDAGGDGEGDQFVTVGDSVFIDANENGVRDSSEQGIANVDLVITDEGGYSPYNDADNLGTTDANGFYTFSGLRPLTDGGSYVVTVLEQQANLNGFTATTPLVRNSAPLTTNGLSDYDVDFGFVVTPVAEEPPTVEEPPVVIPPVVEEPPVIVPPVVEPPVEIIPPTVTVPTPPVEIVPPAVVEPPVEEVPVVAPPVEATPEVAAPIEELAHTGADVQGMLIAAVLAFLAGIGLFVFSKRVRKA